jgi:hypothetical protein
MRDQRRASTVVGRTSTTAPFGRLEIQSVFVERGSLDLIIELTQAKTIDPIEMGTVSRAGIAGLLIGNTAEKVSGRWIVRC